MSTVVQQHAMMDAYIVNAINNLVIALMVVQMDIINTYPDHAINVAKTV